MTSGLSATIERQVTESDTALAVGSGDVEVLATPRLIAWCEQATMAAAAPAMRPDETSVAMSVQIDHVAPSPVGRNVVAEATVERATGRKLVYTVSARDDHGLVGAGRVTRVIVDRQRFMQRCTP